MQPNCLKFGRKILWLILLTWPFSPPAQASAQEELVPVYLPELTISRATGPIKIDGSLQDAGWADAAKANNFAEHNPGDQTKPDVDTEVLITYDDRSLYVAWICYDDPTEVRASFCERDQIFNDDYVILCIDPFGDATLAYEISSNPYGIPGDLLFSSAYGEDISYDMIFEAAGRITDTGWVVEMEIPFYSLRFPRKDEQEWRVDFWRNRPRESRYQYSWAAYDRDEDCWPCQWGTVKGISGVSSGARLEFLPGVVAHQSGALNGDGEFANNGTDGDASLGIAYDITSAWTTEATLNPDFSQIEADAAQIDVNSTFALFYPERRPFFQEGSDLFNTYFNAVYTRSINDPLLAGKLTGRTGSNSLAFLTAKDQNSVVILPFEEGSAYVANGESYSNILRARHDFGDQSHLGFVGTDRRFVSGGSGSLLGLDGQIRLTKSDKFRFQLLATHTEEINDPSLTDSAFNEIRFDNGKYTAALDGESFWGHAVVANLNRDTRSYWLGTQYTERNPTFRADNGFEPANNVRMGSAWLGGIIRFDDSAVFENVNGQVDAATEWNFDGVKKDEWVNTSVQLQFRAAQTGIHSSYMRSNELFGGTQFNDIWQAHTCFSTQPGATLRFGGYINRGDRIARMGPVMGKETSSGVWADVRPIDRFLISLNYDYARSDDLETNAWLFSQNVFRTRLSLQLTRALSLRVVLQYNDRADTWGNWNTRSTWDIDPLITYRINSLTVFYVGSTRNYMNYSVEEDGLDGWTLTERQYFMKLQYLIRL